MATDPPSPLPQRGSDVPAPSADVIPLRKHEIIPEQPAHLSRADALRLIRVLAEKTGNIFVIPYGRKKAGRRGITRRQIELCVQKGTPTEGPFLNMVTGK